MHEENYNPEGEGVSADFQLEPIDPKQTYSSERIIAMIEKKYPKLTQAMRALAAAGILLSPMLACPGPEVHVNSGYNPDNPYYVAPGSVQTYDLQAHNAAIATQQALQNSMQNQAPNTNGGILQPNIVLPDNSVSAPPVPGQP